MIRVTLRRRAASVAGVVVVAASSAAPAAAEASATPRWTLAAMLSRIDGAKVIVGRWSGRVDASSTLCSGDGRGALWAGRRHWSRFTCTWTVFDREGAVDDVQDPREGQDRAGDDDPVVTADAGGLRMRPRRPGRRRHA